MPSANGERLARGRSRARTPPGAPRSSGPTVVPRGNPGGGAGAGGSRQARARCRPRACRGGGGHRRRARPGRAPPHPHATSGLQPAGRELRLQLLAARGTAPGRTGGRCRTLLMRVHDRQRAGGRPLVQHPDGVQGVFGHRDLAARAEQRVPAHLGPTPHRLTSGHTAPIFNFESAAGATGPDPAGGLTPYS